MNSFSLRRASKPFFNWFARNLVSQRVSANEVTLCGFVIGIWAFVMLAYNHYEPAIIFILFNRFFDGIDGAVARQTQETDAGHYLDLVLDFTFYTGLIFFFVIGRPEAAFSGLMVLFAYTVNQFSLASFTIFAEKNEMKKDRQGSLYPLGGLMDGTENFVIVILMCVAPDAFVVTGLIYFLLAILATTTRVVNATRLLSRQKKSTTQKERSPSRRAGIKKRGC